MPLHSVPLVCDTAAMMNLCMYPDKWYHLWETPSPWEAMKKQFNKLQGDFVDGCKFEDHIEPYIPFMEGPFEQYKDSNSDFMVGKLIKSNDIIFAFKGTNPTEVRDVKDDVSYYPYEWEALEPLRGAYAKDTFRVHRGFLKRARGTTEVRKSGDVVRAAFPVEAVIDKLCDPNGPTLHITGHSLGAAVAGLVTLWIMAGFMKRKGITAVQLASLNGAARSKSPVANVLDTRLKCITFGAPPYVQPHVNKSVEIMKLSSVFTNFTHRGDVVRNLLEVPSQYFHQTKVVGWLSKAVTDWVPNYGIVGESESLENSAQHSALCVEAWKNSNEVNKCAIGLDNLVKRHTMPWYAYHTLTYTHVKWDHRFGYSIEKGCIWCNALESAVRR